MGNLKPTHEFLIAAGLYILIIATRFQHFGSALHLPDASWAIFFAGGFYLSRMSYLAVFLFTAGLIDYFAITQFGTSSYCMSPGYAFLVPAYAALWLGGKWFRTRYKFNWSTLMPLTAALVLSVAVCFLISNAAFYLASEKFAEMSVAEYAGSVMQYFTTFLKTTAGYIIAIALVHSVVKLVAQDKSEASSATH